jgi:hypothetical protein
MEIRNPRRRFVFSAARQRVLQRAMHLVAALLVLFLVYAPGGEQVAHTVRWAALPLLTATGIAMWQGPRIRRLLKRMGARSDDTKGSAG